MRNTRLICVLASLIVAILGRVPAVQPDVEVLNPLAGEAPSYFGYAVAADGDRMVVGAPQTPDGDLDSVGEVRVYTRDGSGTWQPEATLKPDTPESWLHFGASVAISGDTAVVGTADNADFSDYGSSGEYLYIFVRDGSGNWSQQARLTPEAGEADFRTAIAISGDSLAVVYRSYPYAVGVYTRSGSDWTREAVITPDDSPDALYFRPAVALSGDRLAVAAYGFAACIFERQSPGVWTQQAYVEGTADDSLTGSLRGRMSLDLSGNTLAFADTVYESDPTPPQGIMTHIASVFRYDGATSWTEEATIQSTPDHTHTGYLGAGGTVRVSDDTLLWGEWIYVPHNAAARVYERATDGTWSLAATLDDPIGCIDMFGFSLALAGGQAIVGAPLDDTAGDVSGAVHVYERQTDTTWTYQDTVMCYTEAGGDNFGYAVAMSDDLAIVGAPFAAGVVPGSGCARIYAQDSGGSWTQVAQLTSPAPVAYDMFGNSVAINASTALVASVHENIETDGSGAAYIFTHAAADTWNYQTRLTGTGAAPLADFGATVALGDDTALVAAPNDTVAEDGEGAAYIFAADGLGDWPQVARLTSPNPGVHDFFASAVSISGDTVAIGCARETLGETDDETRSGAVYVYENDGADNWNLQARIANPTPAYYDYFGQAVCVSSDTLMVGCIGDDPRGSASGSVYVYKRDGASSWTLQTQIIPSDGAALDNFGAAIVISGDMALIASPRASIGDTGEYAGATYVYKRNQSDDWVLFGKMRMPGGQPGDARIAIALSGEDALAGAPTDDEKARDAGAVHFLYVPTEARVYFGTEQTVQIESDGSFYAMATNLTAGTGFVDINASLSGSLSFSLVADEWEGIYVYDYASSQWVAGKYMYKQTLW